jgi:hypothetical protein
VKFPALRPYTHTRVAARLQCKRIEVHQLDGVASGGRIWLHERGGKQRAMRCHRAPAEALGACIAEGGLIGIH